MEGLTLSDNNNMKTDLQLDKFAEAIESRRVNVTDPAVGHCSEKKKDNKFSKVQIYAHKALSKP